jgi:cbb3-type cytochrome c oxidase subunit III
MYRSTATVLIASLSAALLWAASSAKAAPNAFEGRKLYTTYCLVCHGTAGDGRGPLANAMKKTPANLLKSDVVAESDKDLHATIDSGKAHDEVLGMPRWNSVLPGPQIDDIVAYLRFMQLSKYALVGDPMRGKEVYRTYCAVCHGQGGKGDGALTALLPIHPADHTNRKAMDAMSNEDMARTIADGELVKYMPAWKSVLTGEEIESLVGYIRLISH